MTSQRLADKVRRDFSPKEADVVLELLDELGNGETDLEEVGQERVQGAVVLLAAGNSQSSSARWPLPALTGGMFSSQRDLLTTIGPYS